MRGLNWFLFLFPRALACCCYPGEKEVFSCRYNPNFKFRNGRRWVQKQGSSSKKIRQTKWLSFWPDQHHSLHFMLFLRPTFRYVDRFFVHRQLHDVTRAMIQLHLEISITHSATAQKISFLPFSSERRKCVFFSCLRWPSKNGRCQKKKKLNWNWKLVLSFASSSRCGKFIFIAGERLLILEGGGRRPGTRSADGSERDMKFTSVVRAHVGEGCGRGKLCNWQREKEQQSRGGSRRGSRFFSF